MSGQRGNPEPEELIAAGIASALLNVRVAGIGIVKSYDAAKQTCSVEPAIRRPIETDEGDLKQEADSIIQNVMVAHFGSAALSVHTNLASGDTVLLVYLDYSPALWRSRGAVSDTPDTHKHSPSYPVAIPFLRPSGGPGPDTDESLGIPAGMRLHFESAFVRVGPATPGTVDFVAMAAKVNARLDALELQVTLPHTCAAPGSPSVPPPFTPGGGDVSSSTLKAE